MAARFLGLVIGIIQDAMTHLPLGINGIIDCILGYLAASIGLRIDVDNPGTRLIMNFVFILLASILHVSDSASTAGHPRTMVWIA